jgi:hypothetical protein
MIRRLMNEVGKKIFLRKVNGVEEVFYERSKLSGTLMIFL